MRTHAFRRRTDGMFNDKSELCDGKDLRGQRFAAFVRVLIKLYNVVLIENICCMCLTYRASEFDAKHTNM